jgi:hypothetical protein
MIDFLRISFVLIAKKSLSSKRVLETTSRRLKAYYQAGDF